MRVEKFERELRTVVVGREDILLWQVADLERHVDRAALLAGDDPPEPPYWAHVWSGAYVLATAVPPRCGAVLELGCGLGLPGVTAARRGADVTFVDRIPDALAFVRASAAANGAASVRLVAADATRLPFAARFDLVLAAELLYDRDAFNPIARTIASHLAPGGRALLTDAGRIDTRVFYDDALPAAGLRWHATAHTVREEGLPVSVALVEI